MKKMILRYMVPMIMIIISVMYVNGDNENNHVQADVVYGGGSEITSSQYSSDMGKSVNLPYTVPVTGYVLDEQIIREQYTTNCFNESVQLAVYQGATKIGGWDDIWTWWRNQSCYPGIGDHLAGHFIWRDPNNGRLYVDYRLWHTTPAPSGSSKYYREDISSWVWSWVVDVSLTANPTSGTTSVNSTLTANVTGSATGNINYYFWWNCNNTTTDLNAAKTACGDPVNATYGIQFLSQTVTTKATTHLYDTVGTFKPKVLVTRGSAPNDSAIATVTVSAATLTAALTTSRNNSVAPMTHTLTSTAGGTATGTLNYTFWWNCNDPSTDVSYVRQASVCGDPTSVVYGEKYDGLSVTSKTTNSHIYQAPGTYYAKVIIERGTLQAEKRLTITVTTPADYASCQSITTTPASPLTTGQSFSATVRMKNVGTASWTSDTTPHKLGSVNSPATLWGSTVRVALPTTPIAVNAEATFNIAGLTAPTTGGTYSFAWNMIHENPATWFINAPCTTPIVVKPTLTASLVSDRDNQPAPMTPNLTATVTGGTATGSINYTFWWNCSNPSNSVSVVSVDPACGDPNNSIYGAKYNGIAATSRVASHAYATEGTYSAKVIVERDTADPQTVMIPIHVAAALPPQELQITGDIYGAQGFGSLQCEGTNQIAVSGEGVKALPSSCTYKIKSYTPVLEWSGSSGEWKNSEMAQNINNLTKVAQDFSSFPSGSTINVSPQLPEGTVYHASSAITLPTISSWTGANTTIVSDDTITISGNISSSVAVGLIAKKGIIVNPAVTSINHVALFTPATISVQPSSNPLTINGLVASDILDIQRTSLTRVNYDPLFVKTPPPGFTRFLLPSWQ